MVNSAVFVNANGVFGMLDPPEAQGPDQVMSLVAQNVRRLRERAGLSLGQLAGEAGVGKSTLSQLESARANPSIETLWAVARALGVPFGRLLETAAPDVRVVRAGEGVRVEAEGGRYRARLLATSARRGSTELYVLESEPGPPRLADPHTGGVIEHLLVLKGGMRAGPPDAPVDLGPGDLASFAGDVPHVYETTAGRTEALLWMDYA